ncbi:MAG: SsrA-binding protein SmpB [Candidatus Pacebacteria bacterium]|nr:SsrA-binding protein SmpB [Candidatus Paceibacterota bacterium]
MKIFSENKKAYFNYRILEEFEAGMILTGHEVKSIKSGKISLDGSYVVLKDQEVYLIGANIAPYQAKNTPKDYDPEKARKLLLNKSEINYLIGKTRQKGLALVPLKIYTKNAKIKMVFGIAKGKKKFDKREDIKKRDTEREIKREINLRG